MHTFFMDLFHRDLYFSGSTLFSGFCLCLRCSRSSGKSKRLFPILKPRFLFCGQDFQHFHVSLSDRCDRHLGHGRKPSCHRADSIGHIGMWRKDRLRMEHGCNARQKHMGRCPDRDDLRRCLKQDREHALFFTENRCRQAIFRNTVLLRLRCPAGQPLPVFPFQLCLPGMIDQRPDLSVIRFVDAAAFRCQQDPYQVFI